MPSETHVQTEIFKFNTVELNVFPTDISIYEKRFANVNTFLRENASFSIQSPFSRTKYSVVIAFNLKDQLDLENLVKIACYLDKYPFALIKSKSLETLIINTSPKSDDHYIYGIESYTFTQHSDMQDVVILDLTLIYFNYKPLIKDFSLIGVTKYQKARQNKPFSVNKTKKDSINLDPELPFADENESNSLLHLFIQSEYLNRLSNVSTYISNEARAKSEFKIKYPKFTTVKPKDKDYEKTVVSAYFDSDGVPDVIEQDLYAVWNEAVSYTFKPALNEIGSGGFVNSISISKRNNFAINHISDWSHPILQYMGKGETSLSLNISSQSADSTVQVLKACIRILEENFTQYQRYSAYNVLKVDSLLNAISPVFGYVFDQEAIRASSSDGGVYTYTMLLKESDTRHFSSFRLFNPSGTSNSDFTSEEMKEAIDAVAKLKLKLKWDSEGPYYLMHSQSQTIKKDQDALFKTDNQRIKGLTEEQTRAYSSNVALTESGGVDNSVNSFGYIGRYQFGADALSDFNYVDRAKLDAAKAAAPEGMWYKGGYHQRFLEDSSNWNIQGGQEAFLSDRAMQDKAFVDYTNRNIQAGFNSGALNSNSTPEEIAGYAKAAHLKGPGNANKLFKYGIDSTDAYGTSAQKYAAQAAQAISGSYNGNVSAQNSAIYIEEMHALNNKLSEAKEMADPEASKSRQEKLIENYFDQLMSRASYDPSIKHIMQKYLNKLLSDPTSYMDSFDGEALSDLKIVETLNDFLQAAGLDKNNVPGFFFIKQTPYTVKDQIKSFFQLYANIDRENVNNALKTVAKSGNADQPSFDVKVKQPKASEVSDFSEVELQPFLNMGDQTSFTDDGLTDTGLFRTVDLENIDPFKEAHQAEFQIDNIATPFYIGINHAFPAIKVYLVTEDETNFRQMFSGESHSYFELKGIVSFKLVTSTDSNPVDVATLKIANPGSVYTDDSTFYTANKLSKNINAGASLRGTANEYNEKYAQLRIRPGNRLHVKIGYSNNINKLTTVFNGLITEVGGADILDILAEGFGRELIAFEHGDDPTEDNFFLSADTKSVVANAIYSKEISHFGSWRFENPIKGQSDPEMRHLASFSPFGIFKYSFPTNRFTNLYIDEVLDKEDGFGFDLFDGFMNPFSGKQTFYDFPVYKSTPHSMLKEMEYRHPGLLSRPAIYGSRMTYFFGIKEQLYVYRSIKKAYQENAIKSSKNSDLYKKLQSTRYKPISNFHLFTSQTNIISNELKASADFNTVVSVQYYGDADDIESGDFEYYEMKVDDNLKPYSHRKGSCEMLGCHGEYMAYRYGTTYLRYEMEKMYDGTIVVIGNPEIKAGDYAYINDERRGLRGIIKVREAIHHFDSDNGFVTEITPGLYCEASYWDYSQLFSKLHLTCSSVSALVKMTADTMHLMNDVYSEMSAFLDIMQVKTGQENFGIGGDAAIQAVAETSLTGAMIGYATNGAYKATLGRGLGYIDSVSYQLWKSGRPFKLLSDIVYAGNSIPSHLQKLKSAYDFYKTSNAFSVIGASALSFAKGGFNLIRSNPLGFLAGLVVGVVTAKYEEAGMTREPIRIYPLLLNGKMFTAGIDGFESNEYFESVGTNLAETGKEIGTIFNFISNGLSE